MTPPRIGCAGYCLSDRDTGYQVGITADMLEEPTFNIIGWYMRYLAHWEQMDWRDECVSTSEEDESQPSKKPTCLHYDNHPFESCSWASATEKARDDTKKWVKENMMTYQA